MAASYASLVASLNPHLARFLGVEESTVAERMRTARAERNRRWIEADPRTEEDRNRVYAALGELDLLKYAEWHQGDEGRHRLHDRAVRLATARHARVLDVGGGIGDTALVFAANGLDVTYVDLPGVCSDFARFRWQELGVAERVSPLSPDEFWKSRSDRFDMIVSIEVLEHLENPVRHAARYVELLAPGGLLVVTACFKHGPRNPDHLPENDAYRRLFGGEAWTRRRCVLTNLGLRWRRWWLFEKPREAPAR